MDSMTILPTTNSGIQFLDPSINRVLYTTVRGQFVALFIIVLLPSPASCQTAPPPPPPSSSTDLKPGFGVVVLVFTILVFFMSFCSICIRHCNDGSSTAGGHLSSAMTGRSRRGHRGLDPAVIESFPIFKYSAVKEMKIGKGELECAVCLNEFEDDETLRLIPKCDHVFHAECIDMWLESHATCPVCRANLYPDPGESTEPPLLGQISPTAQRPNQTGTGNQNDDVAIDVARQLAVSGDSMEQQLYGRNRRRPPWLVRSRTRGNVSGQRRWFGYFLRSRSTGHVAVEDMERFTLRLPDDVRRQIIGGKLSRTTSCVALSTDGSYRAANRSGFGGSYREGRFDWADRWAFTLTPPFISAAPKTAPPDGLRTTQVSQPALPPV